MCKEPPRVFMAVGPQGPMDKRVGFSPSVIFFHDVKMKMAEWGRPSNAGSENPSKSLVYCLTNRYL
jgi:hypothetical protein